LSLEVETIVIGAIKKNGEVRLKVKKRYKRRALHKIFRTNIKTNSELIIFVK